MARWTSSCIIYTNMPSGSVDLCVVAHNLAEMALMEFERSFTAEHGRDPEEGRFLARPAFGDEELPNLAGFWTEDPHSWRNRGVGASRLRLLMNDATQSRFRQRSTGLSFTGVVMGPGEAVVSGPEGQTERVWMIDSPTLGLAGFAPSDLAILG